MHSLFKLVLVVVFTLAINGHSMGAQQVELHFRSGHMVTGELIKEQSDLVTLKITSIGRAAKTITITTDYQRKDIAQLFRLEDPEDTYLERLATTTTANQHAALANWSRDHAMLKRAIEHAQRALALDQKNMAAATLMTDLGWAQADGTWMKESDLLTSQGKVRFQGKVMTLDEAQAITIDQQQQLAVKTVQQSIDNKTSALAKIDQQLDELALRPPQIDRALAADVAAIAIDQNTIQSVEPLKAAVDTANIRLHQSQMAYLLVARACPIPVTPLCHANGYPAPYIDTTYLFTLTHAFESAQKAYSQARDKARAAEWNIALLRNHMATLTAEKNALDKKAIGLQYKREALARDIEKAHTALAKLNEKVKN